MRFPEFAPPLIRTKDEIEVLSQTERFDLGLLADDLQVNQAALETESLRGEDCIGACMLETFSTLTCRLSHIFFPCSLV